MHSFVSQPRNKWDKRAKHIAFVLNRTSTSTIQKEKNHDRRTEAMIKKRHCMKRLTVWVVLLASSVVSNVDSNRAPFPTR